MRSDGIISDGVLLLTPRSSPGGAHLPCSLAPTGHRYVRRQWLQALSFAATMGGHLAAVPGPCGPPYTSTTTKSKYALSTSTTDYFSAEHLCNDQGGHLASWNTEAEQREVETYFLKEVRGRLRLVMVLVNLLSARRAA